MFRLKLTILFTLLVLGHSPWAAGAVHDEPLLRYGLGTVNDCDVAADGSVYATAGGIGIIVWNARTHERVRILSAPNHSCSAVAVSPDGSLIASGENYYDARIFIWDVQTGQILRELNDQNYTITSLAFSPDGTKVLAGARENTLVLYDVETGNVLKRYTSFPDVDYMETYPNCVCFSPDGESFVATSWACHQLRFYNIDQVDPFSTFDTPNGVTYADFSPDGKQIACTMPAGDDRCFIYDIETQQIAHMLEGHTYAPETIQYSPDGTRLISAACDSMVILWDAQTGERLNTFEGHDGETQFAIYINEYKVVSGDRDGILLTWDPDTLDVLITNHDYQNEIRGIDIAPWSSEIATAAGYVSRIWNEEDGTLNSVNSIGREYAQNVAFVDDERILVGGTGHVYLKNLETGDLLQTYNTSTLAQGLDVSPDGQTFLVAGQYTNEPELWRISGSKVCNIRGNTEGVTDAEFSPDGAWIATGALDGSVRIFDVDSEQQIKELSLPKSVWHVAFSPDNQYLAAVGVQCSLVVWRVSDWSVKLQCDPGVNNYSIAFSPDSQQIALSYTMYTDGNSNNYINLIDIESGDVLEQFIGHTGYINDMGFSPDGTRLYTAGRDGLVLAWPTEYSPERLYDKLLIVNTADPVRHAGIAAQTQIQSEKVYWVAQLRGFRQDNIRFLSTQDAVTTSISVTGPPSETAIAEALGSGADDASRLFIWLIGPGIVDGADSGLYLTGNETTATTLTPANLNAMLDAQQEGNTPLSDVILIVDCDGAGAFVEGCAHDTNRTNRLVIASTQADGLANFGDGPTAPAGISFTDLMLPELMNGRTFYVAFQKADKNLALFNWPIDHPQEPLFDDDGDGMFTAHDGAVARHTVFANRPPLNLQLLDEAKTRDKEVNIELTGQASLSVEVPLPEGVEPKNVVACLTPLDPDAPDQSIRCLQLDPAANPQMLDTSDTPVSQIYQVGIGASPSLPSGKYQVYFTITRTDGYGVTLSNSANYQEGNSTVKSWRAYR